MAAVLRLHRLGAQSLWIDELFSWYSAGTGTKLTLQGVLENLHGPLYALVLHAWTGIAGDSEAAMRFPSAVFGILTVPAMGWLAWRWLGRDVAPWGAWLAAGSPFLVWYSQEARSYALFLLCCVLASGALVGLAAAPGVRRALVYAAASAAALLSSLSYVLVIPAHLAGWWGRPEGRRRRLTMLAAAALIALAITLPWAPQAARTWAWSRLSPQRVVPAGETPLRGSTTFHAGAMPFALHAFAVGYTLGPSLRELRAGQGSRALAAHLPELVSVAVLFGSLGVVGLVALRRRGRLTEALLWIVLPAALLSWLSISNFKVFHPRYLMVSVPAVLLALAAGLAELRGAWRGLAATGVAVAWAVSLGHHYFDPRYGREDYRGMAALLASRGAADERVISLNTDDPLAYYYPGPLPVVPVWLGFVDRPARLDRELDRAMAGAGGVWVVESRPEDLDPRGVFANRFEARFPDAERVQRVGVTMWHLRLRPARP